jgi:uncharacterized membrane protein YsdA (DUF1294 family)
MSRRLKEDVLYMLLWAVFTAAAWFGLRYLDMPLAWTWLAFTAVNIATFLLYGADKLSAIIGIRRVPERVLQGTAFFFGSPGALAGMWLFRHKTSKVSFQFVLAGVILVQILIILAVQRYFLK